MSEKEPFPAGNSPSSREEALNIGILSAIHDFTKLNIGTILRGISQMEFLALYIISSRGEPLESDNRCMHVSAIASILNVSTPAVSRLIKGLEEKGLAERTTDKNDRRNTYVCLTEPGRTVLENDIKVVREFSRRVVERIGSGKLTRLCALTAELGGAVQEELALYSHK